MIRRLGLIVAIGLFCQPAWPAQKANQKAAGKPDPQTEGNFPPALSTRVWYLAPSLGALLSAYPGSSIIGGGGFNGTLNVECYTTPHFGFFGGAGLAARKMTLNSAATPLFLSFPLGLTFQFRPPDDEWTRTVLGVGFYLAFPLSNFADSLGTVQLQTVPGVIFPIKLYFQVTQSFELGVGGNVLVELASPIRTLTTPGAIGVNADLNLVARIQLPSQ